MNVLKFLNERLEEIFLVVLMVAAVVIVAIQIVSRKITETPVPWSEEIARYLFLWLTWVGAAFATKEHRHVNIDVVYNRLSQLGKRACTIISTLVWIVFLAMMTYLSLKLTMSVASGGQVAVGSGLPMWVPYASIPTGMALMLFRLLQNCWYDLRGGKGEKEGGLE
ncbi:TRAP transporter small permease [Oscillospiraceae bacterium 50-16]